MINIKQDVFNFKVYKTYMLQEHLQSGYDGGKEHYILIQMWKKTFMI